MKQFLICSMILCSLAACSHKEATPEVPVSESPDMKAETPPEKTNVDISAPSTMQVSFKAVHGHQIKGIMHFIQDDNKVKAETMIEGLKPGPYVAHLMTVGHCRHIKLKNHKDLAEMMADNKGVVKDNFDFNDVTTNDLLGKAIVIHSKDKKTPKAVACGVVEKL
jgi:Cu-Zn family superoxide dismutase